MYEMGLDRQSVSRSEEQIYEIGFNDPVDIREHEAKHDNFHRTTASNRRVPISHRGVTCHQSTQGLKASTSATGRRVVSSSMDDRRVSGVLTTQSSNRVSRRDLLHSRQIKKAIGQLLIT